MGTVFLTRQPLRFCDTDQLGHINNAVYSVLYEAGRVALLLEAGLLVPAEGHAVVLARLEIDFSSEMTWPADVSIENAFHRIGNKSLHVRQRLLVGGAVTSRSSSVLAVIDTTTRRAVPLQNAWRVVFERWLVPDFS